MSGWTGVVPGTQVKMLRHHSLLVVGTGPAGLLAAIALAQAGNSVVLVGPDIAKDDRRTTALMLPALAVLDRLGVLERLTQTAAPLKTMRIVDATARLIRSPAVTFRAGEIGVDHFGLNMPNSRLLEELEHAVRAADITWHKTVVKEWICGGDNVQARLGDDTSISAPLAVAADGRMSSARAAAGIGVSTRAYPQAALVVNFGHSRPHGFASTEFHTETGPFTQVPLPGQRSSLVWVVAPQTAADLAAATDDALSLRIEERMQSMLGRVSVEPGRQVYPLSATLPARFAQNRVVLVGEAAHVFPPIGAQGLNLGIRDVEGLLQTLAEHAEDPGGARAMARYDGLRRGDILARSAGVNLLNRSLLSDMLPAQLARRVGLSMLDGVSPLRAFFMREGLKPGSGLSGLVSDLREQIRR